MYLEKSKVIDFYMIYHEQQMVILLEKRMEMYLQYLIATDVKLFVKLKFEIV